MEDVVSTGFILTTIITVWLLYKATNNKTALLGIIFYAGISGILGITGFFMTDTTPPRIMFFPIGLSLIVFFSFSGKGISFIQKTDIKWLTLLHVIRIPVEITLYKLYTVELIPGLMTFEGYNFDILSGISAPIIYYLFFVRHKLTSRFLLAWNFICLGLLLNILIIAILSAKSPFQQLAFDQPNIAITYFPFVWLPAVIVPIVLFSHIASIKQLLKQ